MRWVGWPYGATNMPVVEPYLHSLAGRHGPVRRHERRRRAKSKSHDERAEHGGGGELNERGSRDRDAVWCGRELDATAKNACMYSPPLYDKLEPRRPRFEEILSGVTITVVSERGLACAPSTVG